tara:strand:+ start:852 stop:2126 length:1275 start_codon:yes stop_codon:yes gene_type:complete
MSKERDYRVGAKDVDRRIDLLTKSRSLGLQEMYVKDRKFTLKKYECDIDVPRYRLQNHRTLTTEQPNFIKEHGLKDNHFSDNESDQAQIDQHTILYNTALTKGKKVGFTSEMSSGQKQPIIIDGNGLIISGNTRTAFWRELYNSDKTKYRKFGKIEFLLYNTQNEKDIREMEAFLEIKKDPKIEFNWVEKAASYRFLIEKSKYDIKVVASDANKSVKSIKDAVESHKLYEEFLDLYPSLLPMTVVNSNAELAFKAMNDVIAKFDKANMTPEKNTAKKLMFISIRRGVIRDPISKKSELNDIKGNRHHLFQFLASSSNKTKLGEVLNKVVDDVSAATRDKDLQSTLRSKKITPELERKIATQTLVSSKNLYDARNQVTYLDNLQSASTQIHEGFSNWLTNQGKIDASTKRMIDKMKKTLDQFIKK